MLSSTVNDDCRVSVGLHSSTSVLPGLAVDSCRVAPYVTLPTMRLGGLDALSTAINGNATASSTGPAPLPSSSSSLPAAVSRPLPAAAALDPTIAAALTAAAGLQSAVPFLAPGSPLMAAAAAAAAANSMLLYGPPPPHMQYGLNLLRSSANSQATSGESVCSKNNSIAELRMKAKKYAAALGL